MRRKEMKKHLVMLVALLAVVAIAVPAMAIEFKYGGLYRLRWHSADDVTDGGAWGDNGFGGYRSANFNDNQNYMDQRLRMYFSFVASENLQVVTKWEVDTIWGFGYDKFSTGGGVGADSINLEMKNVYVDFNVPYTPIRATLGVQGIQLLTGWIVDDDFSAAMFRAKFAPITVSAGYIGAAVSDVTTWGDRIDDWFISLDYAEGPFKASVVGLIQDGHNTGVSTFFNPRMSTGGLPQGSSTGYDDFDLGFAVPTNAIPTTAVVPGFGTQRLVGDNLLFDLGLSLSYKIDWIHAYMNFVKNFGSYDLLPGLIDHSIDYTGYMIEGGVNVFHGPFTFSLNGFLASGDNFDPYNDSSDGNFRYPRGASHYWSEVLGLGSLDQSVGSSYLDGVRPTVKPAGGSSKTSIKTGDQLTDDVKNLPGAYGYNAADVPSNLWMINFGVAYQALEKTKLTFNYYYIGTQADVMSGLATAYNPLVGFYDYTTYSTSIGHEIDFYVDQGIVDGLNLRLVFGYLFAGEGYTIYNHDGDTWKAGMVLDWKF